MNAKMWMKYPLTRLALRMGATRFGIIPVNFSLDTHSKSSESPEPNLGMCEKEFIGGCEQAISTFHADFMQRDIQSIARYTTPNISTLLADQLWGNTPYVHDISHEDVVVDVVAAEVVQGFVQRPEYPMGFLRARDFMDGMYGPEKFLLHPTEKRVVIASFSATETYRVWGRGEDGERTGDALYDETETVRLVIQLEHDMLGDVVEEVADAIVTVDENWVISGINGYD
jgi:hypothetical protein